MAEHAAVDLRVPVRPAPEDDRLNREWIVGAVTGLSVLMRNGVSVAGDLILVQVSAFAGYGRFQVTGRHDPVLKDSVQTAYNIVRARFRDFGISESLLRERVVAVHLTRIAEPKEGPSGRRKRAASHAGNGGLGLAKLDSCGTSSGRSSNPSA
jgi:ATP-dependent Lon protease